MAKSTLLTILVALVATLAGFYQFSLKEKLSDLGVGRVIKPVGNTNCKAVPEAKACEKIVIHQPTGLVYMACSTQSSRTHWIPAVNFYNTTGRSAADFVAVYDPETGRTTKLTLRTEGALPRGLSVHGMAIAPSQETPDEVLLYLVNHRAPLNPGADAAVVGADSVVEVFRTRPGTVWLEHVHTFEDKVIATPNDIIAGKEDLSFYFTNDHGFVKTGLSRRLNFDILFGLTWSNVGFCHHSRGCKLALTGIFGANGIAQEHIGEGRVFVGSAKSGRIYVTEPQSDDGLALKGVIKHGRTCDNLLADASGAIWAAGLPTPFHLTGVHFHHPEIHTPSSALRISLNDSNATGDQGVGNQYKVETIFEDDGLVASGSTSVAYDVQRKKLYLHGIAAPHLTVCDIDVAKGSSS